MEEFRKLKIESVKRMDKLQKSIAVMEDSLGLYKERLDSTMNRVIENIDPEDWRYYHAEIYSEYDEIETDLPSVLRNSTLVHVYSVFESILNKLCLLHKNRKNLSLSLNDLKHDGIMRAKTYIKKVSNSPFNEESQEWSEIVKINKLRNILVHSDSILVEGKHPNYDAIKQYIDSNSGLGISNTGYISIKNDYVPYVVTNFKKFLEELFNQQTSEFEN